MKDKIMVTRSSMPSFEEYIEEIKDIWGSHNLTNMGPKHQLLESQLKKYLNVEYLQLFTNGHLALEAAIESFDFPKGSEIITTPFTFASTTHAIIRKGYKPVFCDINNQDYTIDVNKIERLVTDKTVAIVPVHVYGNICDVERIKEIAVKYNLKVIYDAAHAFGVRYKNKSSACFGDLTMFSFHATKVFNTIEGGCVVSNSQEYNDKLYYLKNYGINGPEECVLVGGNGKMSEFQAAMGICNLRHLNEEIEKRHKVVERYRERLGNINGIKLCKPQKDIESNYAYFPVVFDNYKYNRNEVFELLAKNDIFARKYFYPLVSDFDCLKEYDSNQTPIAKDIANKVLTLPLYADLPIEDVDRICDIILN